jgi:predicted transcriptional regulator
MTQTKYAEPVQSGLSKQAVDNLAASVAAQFGYTPGAELAPIVEKMNGRIRMQSMVELTDASSGSIRVEPDGSFEIMVAAHTGPARDRFTIAHELGHYVLHFLWPKHQGRPVASGLQAKRYGTGRVEWEANWFAAGFLMPRDSFKAAFAELDGNLASISSRFAVSMEAARVRAEALGLPV